MISLHSATPPSKYPRPCTPHLPTHPPSAAGRSAPACATTRACPRVARGVHGRGRGGFHFAPSPASALAWLGLADAWLTLPRVLALDAWILKRQAPISPLATAAWPGRHLWGGSIQWLNELGVPSDRSDRWFGCLTPPLKPKRGRLHAGERSATPPKRGHDDAWGEASFLQSGQNRRPIDLYEMNAWAPNGFDWRLDGWMLW